MGSTRAQPFGFIRCVADELNRFFRDKHRFGSATAHRINWPLVFNVTENMLFILNKSSTQRLPLQNAMRVQVIFLEKFFQERSAGTYLIDTYSMQKELRSGLINFWLVVYGLSQFLARGNSCRQVFGSWWLVVVVVINVLARGGLWWLVCCFRNDPENNDRITRT